MRSLPGDSPCAVSIRAPAPWCRLARVVREGTLLRELGGFLCVAIAVVVAAPPVAAAATPSVVIGGRIKFRDASREARSEEVERLRWGHISVEMRNGWQAYAARPDANGLFTITGPPGKYRLEYLRLGELAEFFVPHEAVAAKDGVTCIGTIEVVVDDLRKDLGNNSSSRVNVRDDCDAIAPDLGRLAGTDAAVKASPARPVPERAWTPHPLALLVAFRADIGLASTGAQTGVSSLRANYVLPLGRGDSVGHWLAGASLIRVGGDFVSQRWDYYGPVQTSWGGAVGAGHELWFLEAMVWAGAMSNPGQGGGHGPFGELSLRFGSFTFGFGPRIAYYPTTGERVGSVMIDLSPVGLLGHLL